MANKYDLVLDRIFDAPRDLVWKAWTDAAQLQQWWGPAHFTNPVCRADVRPGGAVYIEMRAPDGTVYPMSGTFQDVVEPERIIFSSAALDAAGKPMFEILTTVVFANVGGKTALRLEAKVTSETALAPPHLSGLEQGWSQGLDRLAELVTTGGVTL
jgi:uncharacterized protein YndB with AHSA1/START domain